MPEPNLWIGIGLAIAGWLLPRHVAGAWTARRPMALLLDAAAPGSGFAFALAATARPLFAGALIFAAFGGFAFADKAKRAVLLEPIVFSDSAELIELLRHPQLYLPFAGTGRVIAGAIAAFALFAALALLEPAAWAWSPWPVIIGLAAAAALGWAVAGPWLGNCAQWLRRLAPSWDPHHDSARLGPLAVLFVYGVIARSERASRRLGAGPPLAPATIFQRSATLPPAVVVQCESFFDARRLHPRIGRDLLPGFDACCRAGIQSGRLSVTSWGANTVRTEFAVLTGLEEEAIGLDRFNPYYAFALVPLASFVWRLRAEGYRTICIHPFDRRFYRRDRILPNLGFDVFLGEEVFAGAARAGPYIADVEVARLGVELLREEGPGTFLFAITMENHGPWNGKGAAQFPLPPELAALPESEALARFLTGVKGSDAMLGIFAEALTAHQAPGVLAFYGDHLPSFPAAFAALGFQDRRSDYLIWRPQGPEGRRRDLAAHELPAAILDAMRAAPIRPRDSALDIRTGAL
jgi:hypothetical protein